MSDKKMSKGTEHLTFGVFNPIGYVVLGLTAADAASARAALLQGGYDESEMLSYSPEEVIAETERSFPNRGVLSHLGAEREAAERHQELARNGSSFLVVFAPSEDETARVMRVARRFALQLAQKYDRSSTTDLA
jgi:hypothetical protein